jgi:hypothetical protein
MLAPHPTRRRSPVNNRELERISNLADRLADRALDALERGELTTLDALERGELTTDEFRNNPDVALLLQAAQLLLSAGREFPPSMRRLAAQAAQQAAFASGKPCLSVTVKMSACTEPGDVGRNTS